MVTVGGSARGIALAIAGNKGDRALLVVIIIFLPIPVLGQETARFEIYPGLGGVPLITVHDPTTGRRSFNFGYFNKINEIIVLPVIAAPVSARAPKHIERRTGISPIGAGAARFVGVVITLQQVEPINISGIISFRQPLIVVVYVVIGGDAKLAEIAQATGQPPAFLDLFQGREQDAHENGDDGNDQQ